MRSSTFLFVWPIILANVSAFASHSTSTSLPSIHGRTNQPVAHHNKQQFIQQQQQRRHNRLHKQSGTNLHLSIPRGGAVATAAATKLTEVTSTPTGLFNVALILLGLTTAGLKVFNAGDAAGGDGGGEVVVSI